MRVEAQVTLPVPPELAWRTLLAWERQPEWMRDAAVVRVLTPHREGTGVQVAVKTRVLGMPLLTEVLRTVTWDPPRQLRLAHTGTVRGVGEWQLDETAAGTRLMWTETLHLRLPVLGDLALFLYRPFLRRLMRGSLETLRLRLSLVPTSLGQTG